MTHFPRSKWTDLELELITPDELATLADGTPLVCIDGSVAIKGTDQINSDTRFGYLAYGFLKSTALRNAERRARGN